MRVLVATTVACAGCGRLNFDPLTDGGPIAPIGDGATDVTGGVCAGSVTGCYDVAQTFQPGVMSMAGNNTGQFVDDSAGSCGGAGGGDYGVQLNVVSGGLLTITVSASFDTVLYVLEGNTCDAIERGCVDNPATSGEQFQMVVAAGQKLIAIADSNGACGPVTLRWQ